MKKLKITWIILIILISLVLLIQTVLTEYESSEPSKILTAIVSYPLRHSYQRRVWFDSRENRIWTFVQDNGVGNRMEIYSSTDGETWIHSVRTDIWFYSSSWFNGTHGFMCDSYQGNEVYFQLATCYANGSITLQSLEVIGIGGIQEWWNSITVDSSGYAWIVFTNNTGGNCESWVMKAQDKNGTSWGNQFQLSTYTAPNFYPVIIPLSNNKLYCTYKASNNNLSGRFYNGSGWENEELIVYDTGNFAGDYSVVADSNDFIHIAYGNETNDNYYHIIRNETTWGNPQLIANGGYGYRADPQLTIDENNVFYIYVKHLETAIYYIEYFGNNQSYSSSNLLCNYTDLDGMRYNTIHSFYYAGSNRHKMGVIWSDNTPSPYDIYYAEISVIPVPEIRTDLEIVNIYILFILLFFVNLIFIFIRIPIIAFPIGLFSFYMGATLFLTDPDIPFNPHTTAFFVLIIICSFLSNTLLLRRK